MSAVANLLILKGGSAAAYPFMDNRGHCSSPKSLIPKGGSAAAIKRGAA